MKYFMQWWYFITCNNIVCVSSTIPKNFQYLREHLDHWLISKQLQTNLGFSIIVRSARSGFFKKRFFGGQKFFSWSHWYPCFRLLVMSALGSLVACFLTCVILRFTSGVTPADCTAWQPSLFNPQTCLQALVEVRTRAWTQDHLCSKHSAVYHSGSGIFVFQFKLYFLICILTCQFS